MTQQMPQRIDAEKPESVSAGRLERTDGGYTWRRNTLESGSTKKNLTTPLSVKSYYQGASDGVVGAREGFVTNSREVPSLEVSPMRASSLGALSVDALPDDVSSDDVSSLPTSSFATRKRTQDVKIHVVAADGTQTSGPDKQWAEARRRRFVRRRVTAFRANRSGGVLRALLARFHLRAESDSAGSVWQNYLQKGALAGLMLGCLSMVLFHQVALPASVSPSSGLETGTASASTPPVVNLSSGSKLSVMLPSVRVFVLRFGPYSTKAAALLALNQLRHSGRAAQVVQEGSGFEVWAGAALGSQTAKTAFAVSKPAATIASSSVLSLTWPATPLQTTAVVSRQGTSAVSTWLASLTSVLTVETGVVVGETAYRDANQALKNANKQMPSPYVWGSGSAPPVITGLYRHVNNALSLLTRKQNVQAEQEILSAWVELASLKSQVLTGS
jgi:hypothetical protein